MPGVERLSVDLAVREAERAAKLGIPAIATFPNIDIALRDQTGSNILDPDNLINRARRAIKAAVPEIGIITDVALDPFTSHGHDGILRDGIIVNDETVEQIAEAAVLQAEAGADIIAPSDMMDGRIGAIRDALDANGFQDVAIMSYATKFASAFYGPYREAIGTGGLLKGDKKTYYIDPANGDEAMREAEQDVAEGADMLMVKPGLPYLDIIRRLKDTFGMPTFAYQVSGEYAMIMAGRTERLDRRRARDDRKPARLQARRLRRHADLFRSRCGGEAEGGEIDVSPSNQARNSRSRLGADRSGLLRHPRAGAAGRNLVGARAGGAADAGPC